MIFNMDSRKRWHDDDSWYLIGEISGAIKVAKKNPLDDVILLLPSAKYKFHAEIILREMSPFEEAAFRIQAQVATVH
tara:strand:- start:435 stop:665 length:231 start_codon:yes stop_codon:yes gene_type:complete